jgi:Putative prokaryotic signal transducing protein
MTTNQWVPVASYAASFEADLAVARLESEGILAVTRGNDITGIFGPGFGGSTARGVIVLVPSDAVAAAREILEPAA